MAAADRRELWLVTGSQHLYGDEEILTVAARARQAAVTLSDSDGMPATVIPGPVVTTAEAVRVLCRQANEARQCIGVIFWMQTFAPAKVWASGLRELEKPFCYLHNQHGRTIPQASGHRPTVIVGYHDDPAATRALTDWSRAAIGAYEAGTLVLASLGADVSGQDRCGFRVEAVDADTVSAHTGGVSDREITDLVALYEDSYDVAPELSGGGDLHEKLRSQARTELGLTRLLSSGGYRALTTSGAGPSGLAIQRLMAAGYGFGPVGNWRTAALVRVLKSIGHGPGGTTFLEDSTYIRHASDMTVFGAHALEVCPSVADAHQRPRIEALTDGDRSGVPRLVFSAPPGSAVNAGLVEARERLQLVANTVRVEAAGAAPVTSIVLDPHPDLATASECWALAGGERHTALATNVAMHVLETWAGIVGIGFLGIEAETSLRSFRRSMVDGS